MCATPEQEVLLAPGASFCVWSNVWQRVYLAILIVAVLLFLVRLANYCLHITKRNGAARIDARSRGLQLIISSVNACVALMAYVQGFIPVDYDPAASGGASKMVVMTDKYPDVKLAISNRGGYLVLIDGAIRSATNLWLQRVSDGAGQPTRSQLTTALNFINWATRFMMITVSTPALYMQFVLSASLIACTRPATKLRKILQPPNAWLWNLLFIALFMLSASFYHIYGITPVGVVQDSVGNYRFVVSVEKANLGAIISGLTASSLSIFAFGTIVSEAVRAARHIKALLSLRGSTGESRTRALKRSLYGGLSSQSAFFAIFAVGPMVVIALSGMGILFSPSICRTSLFIIENTLPMLGLVMNIVTFVLFFRRPRGGGRISAGSTGAIQPMKIQNVTQEYTSTVNQGIKIDMDLLRTLFFKLAICRAQK